MRILYHHRTQRNLVEGVHISGVINGLRNLGHEICEVAFVKNSNTEKSSKKKNQNTTNIKSFLQVFLKIIPNTLFRVLEILYNFVLFPKLIYTITKFKPQIIYERYAFFNFGLVLLSIFFKIPIILEVNITTEMDDKRKIELKPIARYFEDFIFRNAAYLIVVSSYLKEHLKNRNFNPNIIKVIPNAFTPGIPIFKNKYLSELRQSNSETVVIGFVGGIAKWYKLHELLSVFYDLSMTFSNIHLIFIGDGPERVNLEKSTAKYKLTDKVTFYGRVSHEETYACISGIDIAVIPSTNFWGSPMKLFEYMGLGKPVIAPNIDVISSILENGVHGILFEYNNFNLLKNALKKLIADSDLRLKMGEEAKKHILTYFTWANVANQIEQIMLLPEKNSHNHRAEI